MKKYFWIVFLLLSIFLILFSFFPIDLPTADLGRHIINGDIFTHPAKYGTTISNLLNTNLFSYTHPESPFVNHHWLSGIIFYLIFNIFGFSGLSIFYFFLILGTLLVLLIINREWSDSIYINILVGIFLIPLIASRNEVRPEGISFIFISLFIYILTKYSREENEKCKKLWLLPVFELFWVNTHIYFIFGPFIVGAFLLEEIIRKNKIKIKNIFYVLIGTFTSALINPYGVKGLIYPFLIFRNYGYKIVENQSIHFLENISFINPNFLWYKILLFLIIATSIVIFIKNRADFRWSLFFISLTFGILGYISIRNIVLFAIVSLPLLTYNLEKIKKIFQIKIDSFDKDNVKIFYGILFIFVFIATLLHFNSRLLWNREFKLSVDSNVLTPIDFIKNNKVEGPFFNNYDVGSFMIFGLFPKEKVFVDNRPEAYPKEFFSQVYIPMQENEDLWKEESVKNKFNVIFFYRLDYTPWGQKFLINRIKDPAWAPVFIDKETIIFLQRNKQNTEVIKKYELPKEMFTIK